MQSRYNRGPSAGDLYLPNEKNTVGVGLPRMTAQRTAREEKMPDFTCVECTESFPDEGGHICEKCDLGDLCDCCYMQHRIFDCEGWRRYDAAQRRKRI